MLISYQWRSTQSFDLLSTVVIHRSLHSLLVIKIKRGSTLFAEYISPLIALGTTLPGHEEWLPSKFKTLKLYFKFVYTVVSFHALLPQSIHLPWHFLCSIFSALHRHLLNLNLSIPSITPFDITNNCFITLHLNYITQGVVKSCPLYVLAGTARPQPNRHESGRGTRTTRDTLVYIKVHKI